MNIPNLQEQVLLAPYTTFKIGGPAKYFVVVRTKDELLHAINEANTANIQWFILGGGSDILVSEKGYDGLVIKMELRELAFIEEKNQVRAEAGVRLSQLIMKSVKNGLSGLEYAIGVPATVGGAVWANLGARGRQMQDFVVEVTVLDENGKEHVLTNEECQFLYRDSIFKHKKWVVVDALFQLTESAVDDLQHMITELLDVRKETQDIAAKCAGCVFINPVSQSDVAAAKLIDDLGLKGKTIGGAQISERHANFIINTGDATADDVIQLISYIKQQVRDKAGVQLHEEIEYIGFA